MRRRPGLLLLLTLTPDLAAQDPAVVEREPAALTVRVSPRVVRRDVTRFGVNLGVRNYWGASQLMSNVVQNPGFEGTIDRTVVVAQHPSYTRFCDDTEWNGRADGFWAGSRYEVRTGAHRGKTGKVLDSRRRGQAGLPEMVSVGRVPAVLPGDVFVLTRVDDDSMPAGWWVEPESSALVRTQTEDLPPGSMGARTLQLESLRRPAEIRSYFDTDASRSGKMLPMEGRWRLAFWVKALRPRCRLHISLGRNGAPPILDDQRDISEQWTRAVLEFDARNDGPDESVALTFAAQPGSSLLIDDVELGAIDELEFPFRRAVIDTLHTLRPGYLRDWQGQLGDTFENRVAVATARRPSRYRPGDASECQHLYSIQDHLALCQEVGAKPWIILPPVFEEAECHRLGKFLREHAGADRFADVIVEFGNENWNAVFRPGSVADPVRHGQAATLAFRALVESAGETVRIRTLVNGQYAWIDRALEFAGFAQGAQGLAVAPYYLHSLDRGLTTSARLDALFGDDPATLPELTRRLRGNGQTLAVAEVNAHTIGGDAPADERDPIVCGAASGAALAQQLLRAQRAGVDAQCAYVLAEYETRLDDSDRRVPLWGLVRDLSHANRFRPTGLALRMLNAACEGDLHDVAGNDLDGRGLTLNTYRSGASWSLAVSSSRADDVRVTIELPQSTPSAIPRLAYRLDAPGSLSSNEGDQLVAVREHPVSANETSLSLLVPARGLVVAVPRRILP